MFQAYDKSGDTKKMYLYLLGDAYAHLERFDEAEEILKQLDISNKESIEHGVVT
jgi:tetratricopeptide (TPR) repeat protein